MNHSSSRALAFTILALAAFVGGCGKKQETPVAAPEPEPILIGAILPLTGSSAIWGVPTREGAELAVEVANAAGGVHGRKLRLIVEDTTGDPKTAVSALQKLLTVDKVVAVLDNSNSSVTLAVAPV